MSVAEAMGRALQQTSISTNIKVRSGFLDGEMDMLMVECVGAVGL
jgi:N-methylhydantoinase B/oxoprolinase/acetone carboxylase alpha subunit